MRLRGKNGRPSRFQQAAFVANSLLSGRASIVMPGVRGGSSAKSARNARRRANKRNRNNISNVSFSSGSMLTGGSSFMGPRRRMQRMRSVQQSGEWNVRGGSLTTNIQNIIPTSVKLQAMQYPSSTDRYENGTTVDFDSPSQHIGVQEFCTKAQLIGAMKNAYRAAFANQLYDGTSLFNNGVHTGQYYDGTPLSSSAWDYNPELQGVGNFRTQEVKFLLEGVYVKRSFQNACSNTLEFKVEIFKARYPLFVAGVGGTSGNENNNPNLYANYQPASLAGMISQINSARVSRIGDEVPQDSSLSTDNQRKCSTYGESLTSFTGINQYYKRCGKAIKFILKPGEQRDITMSTKGKHLMNLPKLRMFQEYASTYHVAVTCRANVVGDSQSTTVSYGSGQYYVMHRAFYKMRYAGLSKSPAHNNITTELSGLAAANQQCINPETDATQVYTEGS